MNYDKEEIKTATELKHKAGLKLLPKTNEDLMDLIKDYARQYYLTAEENDSEKNLKSKEDEIRTLLTERDKQREEAVKAEQERIRYEVNQMALAIANDAHDMTELQVCSWLTNEVLPPKNKHEK